MPETTYPKLVHLDDRGWEIIMSGPNRFRLISDFGNFGYIGCFGSKNAAIHYMNREFL